VSAKDSAGDAATSTPVTGTTALPAASDVTATAIGTDVNIAWSGVSGATTYLVERSADGSTGWSDVGTTAATSLIDPGLANATTYYYRVTAATQQVSSIPSMVVSATTGPASALGVTAVAIGNEIAVSWNAVAGAIGYSVERSSDGSTGWSPIGATTTATSQQDPELAPGTTFYYRVITSAVAGDSAPSNISGATTAPGIAAPTAIAADTVITISWPVVPGAATYTIERSPNGSTGWTTLQASIAPISLNDVGLLNGTNYYYRVTASNSAGSSPVSAVVSAKTGLGSPALTASVNNYTSVVLNWNSVAGATGYTVRRSIDSGTTWSTVGTTSSTTRTDEELVPGSTYEYQVIATDGTLTSTSNNVVVTLPPAQPTTVIAAASGTTITINWAPVQDAASYLVERSPDGSTNWTTAGTTTSACTQADTGLTNDTTYFYRVTAIGAASSSPVSSVVSAKTALSAPVLTAEVNNYTSVALSWNAVTGATSYTAQRSTNGGGTSTSAGTTSGTSLADTGLTPDTAYTYQVIATDGVLTTASNNVGVTLAPGAPASIAAIANGTTITVEWTAVPDASSYLVERSTDGATNWTTAGTTTSANLLADPGLPNYTTYYYRVTAIDAAGSSPPSAVVSAKTALLAPTLAASINSYTNVALSWSSVTGATSYTAQRSTDGGATWISVGTTSGITLSDTGLTPSTAYTYRVVATDGTLTTPSNSALLTLAPAAPAPTASASGTTITVSWPAVTGATSYTVEGSPDGTTNWAAIGAPITAISLANTGLANGTAYYYRVMATSAAGSSPVSAIVSTKTALLSPTLTAAASNYTNVTLAWNAVTGATSYTAQRSVDGGVTWTTIASTAGVSLSDNGLTPDTTYTYQIVATDGTLSTPSNNVSVALSPASPIAQASASGTTITVSWIAVLDAASYLVERSTDGISNWTTAGTTISALTLADGGLSAGTTYYYRVTAIDTAGSSAPSAVVNATTIPLAPSSLTATAASDTQVNLSWTAAPGATGYIVQVSADGSTGWTQVTTVSGTTTSVGGLTASTTYYFRVIADNAAGVSGASTVANATTNGAAPTYSSLTTLYGLASTADGGGFYDVYSIDQTTGADTAIGHLAFGTAAAGRDPVSGKFFYISSGVSTVNVESWDPNTDTNAVVTTGAALGGSVTQAAFRDDGNFFFTDSVGDLYQDNTTTGIVTRRGVIKLNGNPFASSGGDIAFGPDGNLYMETSSTMYIIAGSAITNATGASPIPITLIGATGTGGSNNLQIAFGQNGVLFGTGGGTGHIGQLYTINTSTGTATSIGTAGNIAMGDLASVALYADLSVSQSVTPLTHGQQGTYTITVANAGPDGTIKPITLTDTLPTGVTFVSGSGNGWTFYVNGQTVQAVYAANAAAGSTLPAITLLVAVDPSVISSVTNSASVSTTIFDQNLSNNTSTLTSPVS
jgi:titin